MNLLEMIGDGVNIKPTGANHKIVIDGKPEMYPVYSIKLEFLHYNVQNDRIASWISRYKAEHGESAFNELDVTACNDIIEGFIVDSNKDAIEKTQRSIALRSQERPGVVLADGLIVDGNRRFTCLRRLAAENPSFGWFEAVILPESLGNDSKKIKMLELSIQHGEEEKVGYDPVDRLVGIYNDIISSNLLSKEEYAQCIGVEPKELEKEIVKARYMNEFLEFANAKDQFHLARELKVAGVINDLQGVLKKCKSDDQEEDVKNIVFANMIAEPQGDIVRFVRKMKPILEGPDADRFIERENELAFEVAERLKNKEVVTSTDIAEIRDDVQLATTFREVMESAENTTKMNKALKSPSLSIIRAIKDLDQVEESTFGLLPADEIANIAAEVAKLEARVHMIKDKIAYKMGGEEA
jgi:hypothetical protein